MYWVIFKDTLTPASCMPIARPATGGTGLSLRENTRTMWQNLNCNCRGGWWYIYGVRPSTTCRAPSLFKLSSRRNVAHFITVAESHHAERGSWRPGSDFPTSYFHKRIHSLQVMIDEILMVTAYRQRKYSFLIGGIFVRKSMKQDFF